MKRVLFSAGVGLIVALTVLGIAWKWQLPWPWPLEKTVRFDSQYQAVLLDTGDAYYGKIQGLGTAFPVLTEVYYVSQQTDPETKEVKNILLKRGSEWHAPDRMGSNARHIVMVEPVTAGSKVAELIEALKNKQ